MNGWCQILNPRKWSYPWWYGLWNILVVCHWKMKWLLCLKRTPFFIWAAQTSFQHTSTSIHYKRLKERKKKKNTFLFFLFFFLVDSVSKYLTHQENMINIKITLYRNNIWDKILAYQTCGSKTGIGEVVDMAITYAIYTVLSQSHPF